MAIIRLKRYRESEWTSSDLVLDHGEPGFEVDTGKLKIGRDSLPWSSLPYVGEVGVRGQVVDSGSLGVGSGTNVIPIDTTIPQITEGNQLTDLVITPNYATSLIFVTAMVNLYHSVAGTNVILTLFETGNVNAIAATINYNPVASGGRQTVINAVYQPTDLSTLTFRLRFGGSVAGTVSYGYVNVFGAATRDAITAIEVIT